MPNALRSHPERFQHLAVELGNYWSTIGPISALGAKEKKELGNSVLRGDVLSQHAKILAITKEVRAVNNDELNEAERKTAEVFAEFGRRLLIVASIAFSSGLILAVSTVMYVGRLENEIEKKYEESLQAQHELKELSKRLVDTEERERRCWSLNIGNLEVVERRSSAFQSPMREIGARFLSSFDTLCISSTIIANR